MTYDALDRLTDVTSPMYGTTGAHYSYDVLDNLTSVTAPSTANEGTRAYCYDEHWQLTNVKESITKQKNATADLQQEIGELSSNTRLNKIAQSQGLKLRENNIRTIR